MNQEVQVSVEGDVTTVLLNRQEAGNRLTNAMAGAVEAAIRQAGSSRVILLRGAGPDFCAGRDMQPPAPGSGVKPVDVLREDAGPMLSLFEAWRNCRTPIVGVVRGKAWGIGTVFAGLCDVTLAATSSSFRLGELERGIPPCIAMAPLLDRMPKKALAYLVMSAEEMGADAAQAQGIVSRVLPDSQLEEGVQALVKRMLGFSQASVEAVKLYLDTAPHFNDASAVAYGSSLLANVLASR